MIVIDASAMTEALVGQDAGDELLEALTGEVAAPHLLDVEVLSALRGLALGNKVADQAAHDARGDYFALTIARHDVQPLADRVWELRHQFTSYDACYLALAEALNLPLFTCDAKLDRGGHNAEVRVFHRTH